MYKYLLIIATTAYINCKEIVDIKKRKTNTNFTTYTITYADQSRVSIGRFAVDHIYSYTFLNSPSNGQATSTTLTREHGRGIFDRFKAHHVRWEQKKTSNNSNN